MGSKGASTQTTNQTQSYAPNPLIGGAAQQALQGAQSAAALPFQMPTAPVAPFSPYQQAAMAGTAGAVGMAQPWMQTGAGYLAGSAAPVTGADVANYYNPMASNVMAGLQDVFGRQMSQATGQATQAAGGVGAERIGVAQSELARQQGLAAGQTMAGLYQPALQAAEQQKQMMAGAGYGIGQMGPAAQGAQLQSLQALMGAGTQQQQLQQALMNAQYQNRLAQIAYPFQTPQYLAGIVGGLAPAMGGTTTGQSQSTYQPPTPSPWQQALGVGTALAGFGMGMPGLGMKGMGTALGGMGGGGQTFGGYGLPQSAMGGGYGGGVFARGGRASPTADGGKTIDLDPSEYQFGGEIPEQPGQSGPMQAFSPGRGATPVPFMQLQPGGGHSGMMPGQGLDMGQPKFPQGQPRETVGGDIAKAINVASQAQMPSQDESADTGDTNDTGDYDYKEGGGVHADDIGQSFQEGGEIPMPEVPPGEDPYGVGNPPLYGDYPAQPHFGAGDIASAAQDYYGPKVAAIGEAMRPDPQSPLNVRRWVGSDPTAAAPAATPMPMPRPRPAMPQPDDRGIRVPPDTPNALRQEAIYAANKYGIPQQIFSNLINRESGFRNIRGAAGEIGPGQIMPGTAKELGGDPFDSRQNIHMAARYLKQNYDKFGNWDQAVMAYNAGPGAVASGHITQSTQAYHDAVMGGRDAMASAGEGPGAGPMGGMAGRYMMPRGMMPYPQGGARGQWGQQVGLNPLSMALIRAGATMAATPGPIGSAIGRGIGAAAAGMAQDRRALTTEESINQKAQALYEHAMTHLDRYNTMTPYQQRRLEIESGKTADQQDKLYMSAREKAVKELANKYPAGNIPDDEIEAMTQRYLHGAGHGSGENAATIQHAGSQADPIPAVPAKKEDLKKGLFYKTAKGTLMWDGNNFVTQ